MKKVKILSKWVVNGKQVLGEVIEADIEFLKTIGIKFEIIEKQKPEKV